MRTFLLFYDYQIMATYDGLPVYKSVYDLLLMIFQFSRTFSRDYKYTLGQELKNETIKLLMLIYRANSTIERRYALLSEARETLEVVRLLLRLTKDLKQIPLDTFVRMSGQIEDISKQLL
jgi:23S rRNA-intervening sequence protein